MLCSSGYASSMLTRAARSSSSTALASTRSHLPSTMAQISSLGLACSCRDTALLLPVWMYSFPLYRFTVPKGRTRGWPSSQVAR